MLRIMLRVLLGFLMILPLAAGDFRVGVARVPARATGRQAAGLE